jgi:Zn-dependent peptidase ImmA (M78 family)
MSSPEVSKVFAVAEAVRLWRLYGFTSPGDLVLEDLALALGVMVVEGKLDSADARLIRTGKRGLIRVKEDIPEPGRKRFAVAHEVGHWLLHKNVSQVLACTSEDMVAKYKASPPETEANCFAAELLMPEKLFTPRIRRASLSIQLLKDLAADFQTTLTATAIRYVELSDDYCAVVVSEQGRVRWWRGSERFEELCWIEAGSPLSADTVAGGLFKGESVLTGPQRVDASAWVEDASKLEDATLFEETVAFERYGKAISLLRLP